MLNFNEELIEKAKEATSVEELLELAKENEIELTEDQAKVYFEKLNPKSGELADEELDNVAGGGCNIMKPSCQSCFSQNLTYIDEESRPGKSVYLCNDCNKKTTYYPNLL